MLLLLIIADDFTGALDTGVQFAAYGAATRVMVKDQVDFASCDAQVLVVDTETRHLPPEKAYQIVSCRSCRRSPKMGARHGTGSIMLTVFRSQKAPSAWIRSSQSGMHGSQSCWQSRRMYRLSAARLCAKVLRSRKMQAFWFLMLRMNRRGTADHGRLRGVCSGASPAAWAGRDPGRDPPAGSKAAGALRKCEPHYTVSAG